MSDSERPDLAAVAELEQLINALGEEMAAWRRRAHEAEARLRELGVGSSSAANRSAEGELERENQELKRRLAAAEQRARQLIDRLRFLRQQHTLGAER